MNIFPFKKFKKETEREFEKLTWHLGKDLYRFAYWRLNNTQDAEDVVQETYLRAYRAFGSFVPATNIKAWMMRILINVINDLLRKRITSAAKSLDDCDYDDLANVADTSSTGQDPQNKLISQEIDADLMGALKRLPTGLLYPLLLRELEEMTYADIATILRIPVGTVMSRLFRARSIVRKQLTLAAGEVINRINTEGDTDAMR